MLIIYRRVDFSAGFTLRRQFDLIQPGLHASRPLSPFVHFAPASVRVGQDEHKRSARRCRRFQSSRAVAAPSLAGAVA